MPRSDKSAPVAGAPTWNIEANPAGVGAEHVGAVRLIASGRLSRLTPAGQVAVLGALNTYLTSAKITAMQRVAADPALLLRSSEVVVDVLPADAATVAATLAGLLGTAANITAG